MLITRAFLLAQLVKNLPAMQETLIQSLGQEDPLEKEMATHSSILAWRIPWAEEPGEPQSMGSARIRHDLATKPPPPSFVYLLSINVASLFVCFLVYILTAEVMVLKINKNKQGGI